MVCLIIWFIRRESIQESQGARQSSWRKGRLHPNSTVCFHDCSFQGKGRALYVNKVEPIFLAAGCTLDVTCTSQFQGMLASRSLTYYHTDTTHSGHAIEIAREMKLGYDALVTVSGDGLIHEVLNGMNQHEHRDQAFCIPIAPIPTGSGNGLSLNLLGLQEGLDICAAALNVLKGVLCRSFLTSESLNIGIRTTIENRSIFVHTRRSLPNIIHVTNYWNNRRSRY